MKVETKQVSKLVRVFSSLKATLALDRWLSWLSIIPYAKGCGFNPGRGATRGSRSVFLSHIHVFLSPPPSKINKPILMKGFFKNFSSEATYI